MSLFSKLFGGGSGGTPKAPEAVEHDGFKIFVEPIKEGSGYRLAARIEKQIGGEVKSHNVIRADVFNSLDEANQFSLAKAKQVIDEMGDGLFR